MATKAVQAFFPINCESVTLHDKRDFASKIKVVNLEKGRLPRWTQYNDTPVLNSRETFTAVVEKKRYNNANGSESWHKDKTCLGPESLEQTQLIAIYYYLTFCFY